MLYLFIFYLIPNLGVLICFDIITSSFIYRDLSMNRLEVPSPTVAKGLVHLNGAQAQ